MKVLWLFILCRRATAFPLSYVSTTAATEAYEPILAISTSLFLFIVVFLAVKLAYMKHRRVGTIHALPALPVPASPRGRRVNRHGLVVGCLGSPTWETRLASKLDGTWRRQRSQKSLFTYQLHTHSMTRSASARSRSKSVTSGSHSTRTTAFASHSSHADRVVLPSSTKSSRTTQYCDCRSCSRALGPTQRNVSTDRRHTRYGEFGEFYNARSPGGLPLATRRASPSSIRLVNGPSHSNQVEYSFLSVLPPGAVVASPLMGTRDSFQLSRCSLRSNRKPVPPMPSLPAFLQFHVPRDPGPEAVDTRSQRHSEYLPHFRFSPLVGMTKAFHSQQNAVEKRTPAGPVPNSATPKTEHLGSTSPLMTFVVESPATPWVTQEISAPHPIRRADTRYRHKRSQSCRSLANEGSLPRSPLGINAVSLEDKQRNEAERAKATVSSTPSGFSRYGSVASKKPLKSCLRRPSGGSVPLTSSPDTSLTPSMSDASSPTHGMSTGQSTGDHISIRTPLTEDDIGMLGLDRFRWSDGIKELKLRSSHMKGDSVALVPLWE